jgi:hypothetical protein
LRGGTGRNVAIRNILDRTASATRPDGYSAAFRPRARHHDLQRGPPVDRTRYEAETAYLTAIRKYENQTAQTRIYERLLLLRRDEGVARHASGQRLQ